MACSLRDVICVAVFINVLVRLEGSGLCFRENHVRKRQMLKPQEGVQWALFHDGTWGLIYGSNQVMIWRGQCH